MGINLNDFKHIKGARVYAVFCDNCGKSRGYQQRRFSNRLCGECNKTRQIKHFIKYDNVDLKDYVLKNKNKQRHYRTTCHKCGADRGYIEPRNFNKACLPCSKIKHSDKIVNVNYNSCKKEKGKKLYEISCPSCNKNKGFLPIANHDRRCKECGNEYLSKIKTKISPEHRKIRHSFSVCINGRLKKRNNNKEGNSIFELLGYTFEDLIEHLESKFEPWMSWDNYGIYNPHKRTWNIDHIIPDSSFDYSSYNDEQFKESWSLSNLRPIDSYENIMKSNSTRSKRIKRV